MLAAYFDGALGGSEHAAVERHASTCARCSAHLAALVQLADRLDGPAAFARPWWRRHAWLVPAAALGLTVAVWTSLPREQMKELTRRAPTSTITTAPAGGTVARETAAEPLPSTSPALEVAQKLPAPPPATTRSEDRSGASSPAAARDRQRAGAGDKDASNERQARRATAAPQSERDMLDQAMRADAPRRMNEVVLPDASAPAAPAAEEAKKEQAGDATAPAPTIQSAAPADAPAPTAKARANIAGLAGDARLEARAKALSRPFLVTAPDGHTSWRVTAGRIERSTDGGGTWTIERGPALVAPVIGAAPSDSACWLVDAHGLIVRRDSKGEWRPVRSPFNGAPIKGIEARSATDATLSTADARRYRTTDGGVTWQALP
jgi:hypothetical protein